MNTEEMKSYALSVALSLPQTNLSQPFSADSDVVKIFDKIFMIAGHAHAQGCITLKVDPVQGEMLKDTYSCIQGGYYMNKRHWISIYTGSEISADLIHDLIQDSYLLVAKTLNRVQKNQLNDSDK
ncbi:MmcQ/YjbR family DNA-binding protein [Acinetobacter soli]|uniref:MmcQ/YjbR family DNA-binding protein n=1 Tax=Acinetobacter soli TaxID=487316 RepID=UPI00124FF557|nr:MmcQ/YjbR family DNA-binding protein [Acinetobacter soli]